MCNGESVHTKIKKNSRVVSKLLEARYAIYKYDYMNDSANNNNICIGESVTLSATGAINYLWDNGVTSSTQVITPSTSAILTYSVVGTDINSCSANAQVNITVNPLPNTGPIFHN